MSPDIMAGPSGLAGAAPNGHVGGATTATGPPGLDCPVRGPACQKRQPANKHYTKQCRNENRAAGKCKSSDFADAAADQKPKQESNPDNADHAAECRRPGEDTDKNTERNGHCPGDRLSQSQTRREQTGR